MAINLPKNKMIFVVSGPAASGKTTIATYLSQELAIPYIEGDDYHTTANKVKMGSGIPLTDGDRWDWLITLRHEATKQLRESEAVIITCSSLRRRYRDVFRVVSYEDPAVQLRFLYLKARQQHLQARITARVGHYMKGSMVRSQMECLEEPAQDEFDVVQVDVQGDQVAVCRDALDRVWERLNEHEVEVK
ncbi:related to gluconate kinase [Cephalotrichum gorgonifer]|uniref:Gluconokinase n=1 Tax=Cephalotrichum gorgonifer TaxID=2041049 RepID=A0AAE8MVS8_9PEZI|nr:related to gluconate kinase [Cephalotrichum gorgonifer]